MFDDMKAATSKSNPRWLHSSSTVPRHFRDPPRLARPIRIAFDIDSLESRLKAQTTAVHAPNIKGVISQRTRGILYQ